MNPFPDVPACNHDDSIQENSFQENSFQENTVKDINLEIKPNLLNSKKQSVERKAKRNCSCCLS